MVKRLIISTAAFADIDRIIAFNDERNKSDAYSKKFIKGLFNRLNKLLSSAYRGQKTTLENEFLIIWSDYYIFYYLDATYLIVSKIYHQKEDVSL
jgi:plasmid stabilization system protein ParE